MHTHKYKHIDFEHRGASAVITLKRPEQMNAVTGLMGREIRHAVAQAECDRKVVGIVITGSGKAFCAGVDMDDLQQARQSGWTAKQPDVGSADNLAANPGRLDLPEGFGKGAYAYFATVEKPVIAAVNGAVAGAGLAIILSCDMRFFAESGYVASSFARRGLVAELGISWILPKLVGADVALDILWSSRKVFGTEAQAIGLATRVCADAELLDSTLAYVDDLAAHSSPASMAYMKGQIYRDLFRDPTEAFKEAHRLMKASLKTPDFREGIESFAGRRKPDFPRLGDN